jgi:hypothetical protein
MSRWGRDSGRGSVPRYATRFFSRYDTYRTDRIDPSVCLATIPKYRIERSLRFGIFRYSVRTYNNTLRTIRTCREVTPHSRDHHGTYALTPETTAEHMPSLRRPPRKICPHSRDHRGNVRISTYWGSCLKNLVPRATCHVGRRYSPLATAQNHHPWRWTRSLSTKRY